MKYSIGIDLGGTNLRACILQNMQMVAKLSIKTQRQRSPNAIIADMAQLVQTVLSQAGVALSDVAFIGIGVPGSVNRQSGDVLFATNLEWHNVPLAKTFEQHLGAVPIFLDNDANCAALGEFYCGAGKGAGVHAMLMLTVGTGVGGAVILNDTLFVGPTFGGTELGHTLLVQNGEPCGCGRNGCLEAYASFTALIKNAHRMAQQNPSSPLAQEIAQGGVGGKRIFELAKQGDPLAAQLVEQFLTALGEGVVNFINIFDPQLVVIGGGISPEGNYLTQFLTQFAAPRVYSKETPLPLIRTAVLGGDAGLLGAALLGARTAGA